jgi:hypothetical protein
MKICISVDAPRSIPYSSGAFLTHSVLVRYCRKDAKKVAKLEAQIPYHDGRGNKEEVEKIKEQVAAIWAKTREAAMAT